MAFEWIDKIDTSNIKLAAIMPGANQVNAFNNRANTTQLVQPTQQSAAQRQPKATPFKNATGNKVGFPQPNKQPINTQHQQRPVLPQQNQFN